MATTDRTAGRVTAPRPRVVWSTAVALFLAFLGLLAWQVRAGRDPALAAQATAQGQPAPRLVLVRRVERRIIVERIRRVDDGPGGGSAGQAPPSVASPAAPPSAQVAPAAPVAATPAPAPAPPPQPSAPLVTKTS